MNINEYLAKHPRDQLNTGKLRSYLGRIKDPELVLDEYQNINPADLVRMIEEAGRNQGQSDQNTDSTPPKEDKKKVSANKTQDNQPKVNFFARAKEIINDVRQNKWTKRIVIGGGIVLAILFLVFISWFLGGSSPESSDNTRLQSTSETVPTTTTGPSWEFIPPPSLKSLDFFSPEEPSMRLVITLISVLLIAYFGFMDAQKRDENGDATLTTISVIIVIGFGLLFHALKEPFLIGYMQFNEKQLVFVQILYGGLLTVLAFFLVYIACRQGRRDWTPMGSFLSLIGASGLFFGTIGLGTIAIALLAPESPSYPAVTLFGLFWHREFAQMWSSLIMYGLLVGGVWILGKEAYKSVLAAGDNDLFLAITGSILFVVLYPLGRIFLNQVNPLWIYFGALGISAIMGGLNPQREERGSRSTTPTGEGEERIGKPFIPPYDKLSWQICLLVFFIATTGVV